MKFSTELPVGIKQKDEILKLFSLNDLTVEQLKVIQDRNYKREHPMVWLGKTLSTVLYEIQGHPISAEYRTSGNKIPQLVHGLTLIDASYVLMAGHIHNLGTDLPPFKSICPACGNQVLFSVDLEKNLDMPEVDLNPDAEFEVELIRGYEHKSKNVEDLGIKGKVWKRYTFRLPQLKDAIRNERHWSGTSESTFTERVMADCLTHVTTEDGEEMETKIKEMIHHNLILKLTARDMKEIGREYGNLAPSFRFMSNVQCSSCGRTVDIPIDPNFLYSTG